MTDFGPIDVPDLYAVDDVVCRLDYLGPAEGDGLGDYLAEMPGTYMPSMYALTVVATGEPAVKFMACGENGFNPYEMAMHLAGRYGELLPGAASMNESLDCEHGMSAALCSGPMHY